MARRRRLEPPGQQDLEGIRHAAAEEEGARPTFDVLSGPPIAQIAADSVEAQRSEIRQLRAEADANRSAAEALRAAETAGLLVREVPLDEIDVDFLTRDRIPRIQEDDAWRALRQSIQAHGQRAPIELAALGDDAGRRYGLISGYRRYSVLRRLHEESAEPRWATARAIVRRASTLGQAFLAMVEENEVREGLSYFERARVCVLSVQQGAFTTVDGALETLFASGSPARRSKIRSFVLLVEEAGDLLVHPHHIGERLGLRLAQAVRAGHGAALRRYLGGAGAAPRDPQGEQAVLTGFLLDLGREGGCGGARNAVRRGRPASASNWRVAAVDDARSLELRRTRVGVEWRLRSVEEVDLTDVALERGAAAMLAALRADESEL